MFLSFLLMLYPIDGDFFIFEQINYFKAFLVKQVACRLYFTHGTV